MKVLIIFLMSFSIFANDALIIDDLKSVRLRQDETQLFARVHYPNYRIGGGSGATRELRDCFLLDVIDSDNSITLTQKRQIAHKIKITQHDNFILKPEVKGENIVFKIDRPVYYVTEFVIEIRSDKSFADYFKEVMPPTAQSNALSQVNLLYVRDCRL